MVKRKTSCGNARMRSMLLTNVTRSASYDALPNHRSFPTKSGLTSRVYSHEKLTKFRGYLSQSGRHAPFRFNDSWQIQKPLGEKRFPGTTVGAAAKPCSAQNTY